jgi:hypothetical protein
MKKINNKNCMIKKTEYIMLTTFIQCVIKSELKEMSIEIKTNHIENKFKSEYCSNEL